MRAARGDAWARSTALLAAVLLALLALSPVALADDPSLRGQWHLDATSGSGPGTTTPDSSGNGNTGTFTATPTLGPGRFGQALNTGWMNVVRPAGASWGLEPQHVSLTAWIKQAGWPGTLRYVAAKGDTSAFPVCAGSSYALYTGYSAGGHDGLQFYVIDSTGVGHNSPKLGPASSVWDGAWHAVTGTYDGTSVRLYLDGVEVGTGTPATGDIKYAGVSHDNFTVGTYADKVAGSPCGIADWPGPIDEVRVHGEALTPAQVAALHDRNATSPPDLGSGTTPPRNPGAEAGPAAPAGPPGAPQLALAAHGFAGAAGGALLDAGATTGASRLLWDLNSDGRNDLVTTGTSRAVLVQSLAQALSSVKLTAVGVGGSATTTQKLTTIPSLLRPALAQTLRLPGTVTTSAPSGSALVAQFGRTPLSGQICLQDETVTFGFVEATGCYTRTSQLDEVPEAERGVVASHYESPIFVKTVLAICNKAASGQASQKDCDDAHAFFAPRCGKCEEDPSAVSVYVSKQPVKLNGLTVTPRGSGSVVLYPFQERLISSNATLKWGSFTISQGVIDLNLSGNVHRTGTRTPEGSTSLLTFRPSDSVSAIAGFPLNGTVTLGLQVRGGARSSFAALHAQLPPAFNLFGGTPPSGDVQVSASNADGGPTLDALDLRVPEANLGAAYLRDVRFRYARNGGIDGDTNEGTRCGSNEWKAQAALFIGGPPGPGSTGIVLVPPPSQNGVGFCGGGFKHAGGKLIFARAARPEVFPGVFLDYVDVAMQLDPTVIRGGGGLSVGDISRVTGEMLVAFASPGQPYRLSAGDAGAELQQFAGKLLTSTTIAVGGTVNVNVPAFGDLALGNAALLYSYPGSIEFGGSLRVVVPGMSITGGLNGWIQLGSRKFQLSGSAQACIAGLAFGCVGGLVMVGSRGMVACINVGGKRRPNGTFDGGVNPGAGYYWGDVLPHVWLIDGCKPSLYWEVASASSARAAADRLTFRVALGERAKELEIRGTGAAPRVRITAPGGEVLTLAEGTWAQTRTMSALRQDGPTTTTYAAVKDGRPGVYTIERLPGSAPLKSLAATRPGYDTSFRASVSGHGDRRTLSYDVGLPSRKRVTFVERTAEGAHELGTVTSGRGTIRFTPAPGAPGVRRIVSVATLDGTPIPDQTLASFRVTNERVPAPAGVRVSRRGRVLEVRWDGVPGARAYGVVLRPAGGATRALRLGGAVRRATLRGVADTFGGSVVVTARDARGRWSRPAKARYARVRAPYTALQTATRNEKRAARRR